MTTISTASAAARMAMRSASSCRAQGAGFMEAVEQLAGEAGLEVPKATREAARPSAAGTTWSRCWKRRSPRFQRRLFAARGRARAGLSARARADRRDDPPLRPRLVGRGARRAGGELAGEGIAAALLGEAGLMQAPEDGRGGAGAVLQPGDVPDPRPARPHDQLRRPHPGRRPAEIRQRAGDRRVLQAAHPVRPGSRPGRRRARGRVVVAVEGYMDVIALHQAGFRGAVAPLGTALTEEQLEILWQLAPEPVLCFDGDAAGGARRRARHRRCAAAARRRAEPPPRQAARRRGPGHPRPRRPASASTRCWRKPSRCISRCSRCIAAARWWARPARRPRRAPSSRTSSTPRRPSSPTGPSRSEYRSALRDAALSEARRARAPPAARQR